MDAYGRFKAELGNLCERGKIGKNLKNKLSHYDGKDPSEMVYAVCSDFYEFVLTADNNAEVEHAGACVVKLIDGVKPDAPDCLAPHYDTVAAYVKLAVKAHGIAEPFAADKVKEFYERFCESLECIKYGLPLF